MNNINFNSIENNNKYEIFLLLLISLSSLSLYILAYSVLEKFVWVVELREN